MRYFSDINEKLYENDFEWQISKINEGLGIFKLFKNLLAKKSSLARAIFSIADNDTKDIIKTAINNDKLKELNSGIKWWDMYFTTCAKDFKDAWFEINHKDEDKKTAMKNAEKAAKKSSNFKKNDSFNDSLDDITQPIDEAIANGSNLFSKEKIDEYEKVDGMTKAIITGLTLMYDIAQGIGGNLGKERMNYVNSIFDELKKANIKDKQFLEKILKQYETDKKDNVDNISDDNTKTVSKEEAKSQEEQNDKASNVLGSNFEHTQKMIDILFPAKEGMSVQNDNVQIDEANDNIGKFKEAMTKNPFFKEFLLDNEDGKKSFINLINAMDTFFSKTKFKEGLAFLSTMISQKDALREIFNSK